MADSTIDVTGSFDSAQKLIKIVDNGDSTYSIASVNPAGLVNAAYDSVVITYTDATKATIASVAFKLSGDTVCTLTLTEASTTDTWARS